MKDVYIGGGHLMGSEQRDAESFTPSPGADIIDAQLSMATANKIGLHKRISDEQDISKHQQDAGKSSSSNDSASTNSSSTPRHMLSELELLTNTQAWTLRLLWIFSELSDPNITPSPYSHVSHITSTAFLEA